MIVLDFFKKLPLALSGLALAFASLGNAVAGLPVFRTICGILSAFLVILVMVKLFAWFHHCRGEMANPITAGTLINLPSAIMLLSTYLPRGSLAFGLWILGLVLNLLLIFLFTRRYVIREFRIRNVYPSWFAAYIGVANATVAAPHHGLSSLGMVIFWLAFAAFVPVFALVTYRTLRYRDYIDVQLPTLANIASPCGLLLAAFMSSSQDPSFFMVYLLLTLALFFYGVALILLPGLMRYPFSPSFASFTAPFVISASGIARAGRFLTSQGRQLPFLKPLFHFQIILAGLLCFYVLFKFLQHMEGPCRGSLSLMKRNRSMSSRRPSLPNREA